MSNYEPTALSRLVRDRRRDVGLTQEELSYRIGMSQEWVSMLERGRIRQPRISTLRPLAKELDLPFEHIQMAAGLSISGSGSNDVMDIMDRMQGLSPAAIQKVEAVVEGLRVMEGVDDPGPELSVVGSRRYRRP